MNTFLNLENVLFSHSRIIKERELEKLVNTMNRPF